MQAVGDREKTKIRSIGIETGDGNRTRRTRRNTAEDNKGIGGEEEEGAQSTDGRNTGICARKTSKTSANRNGAGVRWRKLPKSKELSTHPAAIPAVHNVGNYCLRLISTQLVQRQDGMEVLVLATSGARTF